MPIVTTTLDQLNDARDAAEREQREAHDAVISLDAAYWTAWQQWNTAKVNYEAMRDQLKISYGAYGITWTENRFPELVFLHQEMDREARELAKADRDLSEAKGRETLADTSLENAELEIRLFHQQSREPITTHPKIELAPPPAPQTTSLNPLLIAALAIGLIFLIRK